MSILLLLSVCLSKQQMSEGVKGQQQTTFYHYCLPPPKQQQQKKMMMKKDIRRFFGKKKSFFFFLPCGSNQPFLLSLLSFCALGFITTAKYQPECIYYDSDIFSLLHTVHNYLFCTFIFFFKKYYLYHFDFIFSPLIF